MWRGIVVLVAVFVAGCANDSSDLDAAQETVETGLLTPADLGDGWVQTDAPQPLATRASLDPPCPIATEPIDFLVDAIATAEIGNEAEQVGFSHTVVALSGNPEAPDAVRDAWADMDCSGADFVVTDFDVSDVDGAEEVVGVQFTARSGPLVQVALVRAEGDEVAFLVVSGEGETPIRLARTLATEF